ncbi:hypothetical protein ACIQPQ_26320 [Streptomyces sp. NPDC091281]|uniref:hypothetical protein n=1 Tax=Streptomyces sp. NPDC091281 TaxID=3365985 RepID=UPI003807B19E
MDTARGVPRRRQRNGPRESSFSGADRLRGPALGSVLAAVSAPHVDVFRAVGRVPHGGPT